MLPVDVAGSNGRETNHQVILEMSRITKQFGLTQVLTEVDFALRKGEIHALMGENGAGKSTLMKIAAGLIEDFEGEIGGATRCI
jgi:ribose transport system ATP-binding protein